MFSIELLTEIRGWLTLTLAIIGGFLSLRTYIGNQKQRRLENSFRMIGIFTEGLHDRDMKAWEEVFHATSESAGAKKGFFIKVVNGRRIERPLSDHFSEGSPEKGSIQRMAELMDLISDKLLNDKLDNRLIYFQLGQLMNTVHAWLTEIEVSQEDRTFIEKYYPNFDLLYKKKLFNKQWGHKRYNNIP